MHAMALPARQGGAVLAVALFLLLVMTLIAVTGMRTAILEEKQSGNARNAAQAQQRAESAATVAQQQLESLTELPHEALTCPEPANKPCPVLAAELYQQLTEQTPIWLETHGTTLNSGLVADLSERTPAPPEPRYVVEESAFIPDSLTVGQGQPPGRYVYTITAVGTGDNEKANRKVRSTYVRRF